MRRVYSFLGGIILVILILFGLTTYLEKKSSSTPNSDKLVIYNWGDYID
ncbi:spermidine/putrescine ABC transporter substrate-binding protein, partial [Streptococcus agalactiae]|nr:spermidine/putrescine ABC transporter substrate-binding protein [Streptococcus agalactiae]MCK6354038.1 spermidine/putrescine ABC transporter substrate-binding protein [Streptococcus agalactiae]